MNIRVEITSPDNPHKNRILCEDGMLSIGHFNWNGKCEYYVDAFRMGTFYRFAFDKAGIKGLIHSLLKMLALTCKSDEYESFISNLK